MDNSIYIWEEAKMYRPVHVIPHLEKVTHFVLMNGYS